MAYAFSITVTYRYIPIARTIFSRNPKLPPGHWLLWETAARDRAFWMR